MRCEVKCPPRGGRRAHPPESCTECRQFEVVFRGNPGGAIGRCRAPVPSWVRWPGERVLISAVEAGLCAAFQAREAS